MYKILKENIYMNIIVTLILALMYPSISTFLNTIHLSDSVAGNILVSISIISVIACFGNYAFTYEKINHKKMTHRYLAHVVTGIFLFIIGTTLIFLDIMLTHIMGHFIILDIVLILLYLANIGYNIWDILRVGLD